MKGWREENGEEGKVKKRDWNRLRKSFRDDSNGADSLSSTNQRFPSSNLSQDVSPSSSSVVSTPAVSASASTNSTPTSHHPNYLCGRKECGRARLIMEFMYRFFIRRFFI